MDPIDFIDSKDIRAHLKKIDYKCEPIEASYLIYQSSKKTIDEKHEAWNWLIENTRDVPVPARNWLKGWDSLHKMLSDYMAIEDCLIGFLQEDESGYVYFADGEAIGCKTGLARSYRVCFDEAIRRVKQEKNLMQGFGRGFNPNAVFKIEKVPLEVDEDGDIPEIVATFNAAGRMLNVYSPSSFNDADTTFALPGDVDPDVWGLSFEGMWFDIPIPFERGDVVRNLADGHVFVLEGTVPELYREHGWSSKDHGDSTDMGAFGRCSDCIYEMIDGSLYSSDHGGSYLDLEYAPDELVGEDKVLVAYGAYLKGDIFLSDFLYCAQSYRRQSQNEEALKFVASIESKFSKNH